MPPHRRADSTAARQAAELLVDAVGDKAAKESALKAAPKWLNDALVAVHDLERAALFPVNRFAGVTAFCLARKPQALAERADAA